MKPLKKACTTCQKTYSADGYRLGFSTLYVGTCTNCDSTHTTLSGSPGSIMFDSMRLADLFMDSAMTCSQVLGIRDPFLLDDHQLMAYAKQ